MRKVCILNGPNLNLLGHPAMGIYGSVSLADIEKRCGKAAKELKLDLSCRQTNHEGVLVDWIQECLLQEAALIINPGALAFTSVLVAESVKLLTRPVIEVHLSNTHKREAYYKNSLLSANVTAVVIGLGPGGYELALRAMAGLLQAGTKLGARSRGGVA